MYADILNGLIFDAIYGSWILSLLLFTLDNTYLSISFCTTNLIVSRLWQILASF